MAIQQEAAKNAKVLTSSSPVEGSSVLTPALERLLVKMRQTIQASLAELEKFRAHAGDVFPRALQDVTIHLKTIHEATEVLRQPPSSSRAYASDEKGQARNDSHHLQFDSAMLSRAAEACNSHLAVLRPLLYKYYGGSGSHAKGQLTARAVKELYQEQDIPKVQKGLSWCEQVFVEQSKSVKRS